MIGTAIVVAYGAVLGGFIVSMRRRGARWERERRERDLEHGAQMADLAHQRQLRDLEERRLGLLRGRDRACRLCDVDQGTLTGDELSMDVEACFGRTGIPVVPGAKA